MKSSPVTSATKPQTTSSRILNDCLRSEQNTRKLADWIVNNPWIDSASLYMTMPGFAELIFQPQSKAFLVEKFGASGWVLEMGEAKKSIDGISIRIRRDNQAELAGEIPADEMLK